MTAAIRPMRLDDADACGRVAYDAHRAVAAAHGFPPEHSSVDFSIGLIEAKLSDPNAYGCLAEDGGRILGGFVRGYELGAAVRQQNALVVERAGRITGYLAGLGLRGHAAAATAGDLKALIAGAGGVAGPGFFVPRRSRDLFSWAAPVRPACPVAGQSHDAWTLSGACRCLPAGHRFLRRRGCMDFKNRAKSRYKPIERDLGRPTRFF